MAKSPAEQYRELSVNAERPRGEVDALRADVAYERGLRLKYADDLTAARREFAAELTAVRREVADLRTEHVALAREVADHRRRGELWAARFWALGVAVLVAVLGGSAALLRRVL